jgi:hypothetical protein
MFYIIHPDEQDLGGITRTVGIETCQEEADLYI